MFKKILGIILCIATLSSMVTPAYAAKDSDWKVEVLQELGIYQDNPVTYDNFIASLAGFYYENPAEIGSAEEFAKKLGMVEADEKYMGQGTLTVGKALRLAVIALGYKPILGTSGNYTQKAAEVGIADKLSGKGNDKLKATVAADILYAMLEVAPVVRTYGGKNGAAYEVAYGETLLSINRDIYDIKGLLTATEVTSIYGQGSKAKEDHIVIDETTYYVGESNFDDLLGKNVIGYAQKTDSVQDAVLYVIEAESKNKTITIDSEYILSIGKSISDVTYKLEGERKKTIEIVATPKVLFNGKYLKDYKEDDFKHGVLEFIDYNNDRKYDIIKISSYQIVLVESIDSREKIIKNRYRFYGSLSTLELNTQKGNDIRFRIFDGLGSEVDFSAIKVDDVLSVARSRDGSLVNIYISGNDKMAGTITGMNNAEDLVYIDRQEYKKSEDFKSFLTDTKKTLEVGELYTFYFDTFGRIAYIKEKKVNDYNVLIKVDIDYDTDEYYAVHMDMNGDWYTTPISEKARIEGEKISYYDRLESLKADIKAKPQIVILKLNSKNQIIDMDFPKEYNDIAEYAKNKEKNEGVFCSIEGAYNYRDNGYFQGTTITDIVYPEAGAKVIVIPTEGRNKEENWEIYSVGGFFKVNNTTKYEIKYFNPDKFNFTDLFVVTETEVPDNVGMSDALYVITGFEEILVDGDPYPVIEGSVDGFMNLSFLGSRADIFDGLKIGDVIKFNLDDEGRIKYVDTTDLISLAGDNFKHKQHTLYYDSAINAGKVKYIDYEAGKIMLQSNESMTPFKVSPTMQVTYYYGVDGCESKSLSNINEGDNLIIRTTWGKVVEIICDKD